MPRPVPSTIWALKRVDGANPAANAEVADAVPAGKTWELLLVSIPLVQGLTQTPQPILQLTDAADAVIAEIFGSSAAQAASTTCRYTWGPDLPLTGQIGVTTGVRSTAPLPSGIYLPSGFKIKTATLGLGANSDYGVPSYLVIEYG
jgi:hypothetical protein